MISTDIGVWIAAFFTIFIMSYAYKDNPLFKFAEHVYVGAAAGHAVVMGIVSASTSSWIPLTKGQIIHIIPLVLGLLLYTRYHPRYYWVSRYPIALLVGLGTAISIRTVIAANFTQQIAATIKPLSAVPLTNFNNLVVLVVTVTVLWHFLFTQHKLATGNFGLIGKFGRYAMMVAFGAAFGNTVMTRMVLLLGRVDFLLFEWLKLR
jgi:hypothetical protein